MQTSDILLGLRSPIFVDYLPLPRSRAMYRVQLPHLKWITTKIFILPLGRTFRLFEAFILGIATWYFCYFSNSTKTSEAFFLIEKFWFNLMKNGMELCSSRSYLQFWVCVFFIFVFWLDSNRGPAVKEATALPTEPQLLDNTSYAILKILDDCSVELCSVWPDLSKCHHFGIMLTNFGDFESAHLIFGKISNIFG